MARKLDLDKHSISELKDLIANAEKAIEKKAREELKKAKAAAAEAVKKFGFTLDEVTGGKPAPKTSKAKSKPKYANPDDASQTWSGRGRQPAWYKKAIDGGKKPEDMLL